MERVRWDQTQFIWFRPNLQHIQVASKCYHSVPRVILLILPSYAFEGGSPSRTVQDGLSTSTTRNNYTESMIWFSSIPRVPPEGRHPRVPAEFQADMKPCESAFRGHNSG